MADEVRFRITVHGVPIVIKDLNGMDRALKLTKTSLKQTELGTTQFSNRLKELSALKGQQMTMFSGLGAGMQKMGNQTNQAGVAMQNMNFVIRDSPYFFKDLQLGVLAVGNNMNPLIDSFQRLKIQATEMTKQTGKNVSAFGLLRKSMAGPMGLSIAMSILVTAIQAVVFSMGSSKDATRNLTKAIEELWSETYRAKKQWDEFVLSLKDMTTLDIQESIRALTEKLSDSEPSWIQAAGLVLNYKEVMKTTSNAVIELTRQLDALKKTLPTKGEFSIDTGIIANLEARIEMNTLLRKSEESEERIHQFNILIKKDQDEINRLLEKQNKILKGTEKLLKSYVVHIRTVEDALRYMTAGTIGNEQMQRGESYWEYVFGDSAQSDIENSSNEIRKAGESTKIFGAIATQTGTLLAQAFMHGTFALDRFFQSLIATIAQMLILKGLMSGLSFGGSGLLGGSGIPFIGPLMHGTFGALGKRSQPQIMVGGKIEIDKNKFVVQLNRATTQQAANYGVGDGVVFTG